MADGRIRCERVTPVACTPRGEGIKASVLPRRQAQARPRWIRMGCGLTTLAPFWLAVLGCSYNLLLVGLGRLIGLRLIFSPEPVPSVLRFRVDCLSPNRVKYYDSIVISATLMGLSCIIGEDRQAHPGSAALPRQTPRNNPGYAITRRPPRGSRGGRRWGRFGLCSVSRDRRRGPPDAPSDAPRRYALYAGH